MEYDYTISIDEEKIELKIIGPVFENQVGIFKSNCRGVFTWEVISAYDMKTTNVFNVKSNLKIMEEVNVSGRWMPNPNLNKKEILNSYTHNNRGIYNDRFIIERFERHLIQNYSFNKKRLKKPVREFIDFLRTELQGFLLKNEIKHMMLEMGKQKLKNCLHELVVEKIQES